MLGVLRETARFVADLGAITERAEQPIPITRMLRKESGTHQICQRIFCLYFCGNFGSTRRNHKAMLLNLSAGWVAEATVPAAVVVLALRRAVAKVPPVG